MKTTMSEFYCVKCGNKGIPIWRKVGQEREGGHLKKIWCIYCKQETNHVECRPFSHYDFQNFKLEYEYGNFSEEGNRIRSYKELKEMVDNGKLEKTKTVASSGNSWQW